VGLGAPTRSPSTASAFHVFAGVRRQKDGQALRRAASERLLPVRIDVTDGASITAARDLVAPGSAPPDCRAGQQHRHHGTDAQRDGAVVDHLWTLPARHDEGAGTGGKVLADQHADVLRQAVAWLTQGADGGRGQPGRRCPLRPTQSRPGWRAATATASRPGHPGRLDRAAIPRLRSGSYLPSFLESRRSEQALVAVVQEATSTGSRPQGRPAGRGAGAGRDVHRSGVTALPRPG
jgi:hypothetical protein